MLDMLCRKPAEWSAGMARIPLHVSCTPAWDTTHCVKRTVHNILVVSRMMHPLYFFSQTVLRSTWLTAVGGLCCAVLCCSLFLTLHAAVLHCCYLMPDLPA